MRDLRDDVDNTADGICTVACRARAADNLDVIHVVETKAVHLVRCTVELAQSSCESAPVDEDKRVARLGSADADGLAPHVVRAHLDVLLRRECVRERTCPLAVKIGTGDDRLCLGSFLEHLFIEVHLHVDIFG